MAATTIAVKYQFTELQRIFLIFQRKKSLLNF